MELSAMATRRMKLGLALEASLEISTPEAGVGLVEFYAPVARPEDTFDFTAYLDLNLRKLRWCREQVVETDMQHRMEAEKLTELIGERDELVPTVGGKLVRLRQVCQGLCDDKELLRMGLDGAVAQDPILVLRQGQKVVWRFEHSDGVAFDSQTWPEAGLEAEALRRALTTDVEALGALLKEIQKQRRRVERAAKQKAKAFEDFDQNYRWIGRASELAYLMADMKEEAERARPTTRRLDRNVDPPLPPPADSPTEDDPVALATPVGNEVTPPADEAADGDLVQDDAVASGDAAASGVPQDPVA